MQGIFNLEKEQNYEADEYIVTPANSEVYQAIFNWQNLWGYEPYKNFILLYGPKKSGKTHIAHIWQRLTSALFLNHSHKPADFAQYFTYPAFILDDAHLLEDTQLLHLFNLINDSNKLCLITTNTWPPTPALMDLHSRLNSLRLLELGIPGYDMVYSIIAQLFKRKNLQISPAIIRYLCLRLPADMRSIISAIELIDRTALVMKVNITVPFIKKVLGFTDH